MDKQDDTSATRPDLNQDVSAKTSRARLQEAIDCERARLLQVSSVLHCLYEVLLYAEGDDAVTYAETAHLAVNLIDESVERLDTVRLKPLIDALKNAEGERTGFYEVREPRVAYIN